MMHSGSQRKSVFSRLSNPSRSQSHLRSDVSVIGDSHIGCKDDEKKKRNVGNVFSRLSYGPTVVARKNDSHQRPCSDLVNKKQGTGSGYSSNCQSHSREIASSNSNADDDSRGKRNISNVMVNNSGGRAQLVVDFKHRSAAWKSKDEVPPKTKAKTQTTAAGEREREREGFSLEDMSPKRRRKLVRPSFSLENKDEDSQPATLPASSVVASRGTTSCVATPAVADSPSACIAPCAVDFSSACVAQRAAFPFSCVATPASSACIAPCAADSSSACVAQRSASLSSCVATPTAADSSSACVAQHAASPSCLATPAAAGSPSHADSSSASVAQHAASPSSCVAMPAAADSSSHADSSPSCVAQDAASPSSSVAPLSLTIPTSKKRLRELMEEETRMPPKRARLSCMCVHADAALAKAQLELMKLSLGSSDEDVNKVGWSLSPSPSLLSLSSSSVEDDNKVGLAPLSLCRSDEDDKEVTPLAQTTTSFSSDEDDEKVALALLLTPTSSSSRSEEDALPQPAPVSVVTTVAAHDVDDDIFARVASILARDIIDELDLPGRYAETQKMIDRCTEIQNRIDKILWIYGY